MFNNITNQLLSKLISLPGLLIAITFHELAHGYFAYRLGDPTAKNSGRLSLNPLAHIDIVGFLLLFIVGFGWAKPVPINPMYFKKRKSGTIIVSLAGPISNFAIAIILALIIGLMVKLQVIRNGLLLNMILITIWYNIILGIFNLLPFPPLDGSKILASLLPIKFEMLFYRYEKYLYAILILLIVTNSINKILGPLVQFGYDSLLKCISLFF